jgi:molybdopterin converting factor small subunit
MTNTVKELQVDGQSATSGNEAIEVRISRQVLWVGAEAYPLRNIARAQTITLVPDRWRACRRYLTAVVFWVLLGVAAVAAIKVASRLNGGQGSNPLHAAAVGALVLALALFAVSTIRLIRVLSARTYYALVIETAGTPRRALVSTDGNLVRELVRQIMKAIDDPQAEFRQTVINHHYGDKIYQNGDFNVGKVSK